MSTSVVDSWRGVAAEEAEEIAGGFATFLRSRSRRLLGSLLRPHKRNLVIAGVLIVTQNLAATAGPVLVKVAIDRGIPALAEGRAYVLMLLLVAFVAVALVQALATRGFLLRVGEAGQDVLLDLRTRVFDHFQRLSLAFHERYTSGRVVSRLTSDVEAIAELLQTGLQTMVTAVLSVVTTTVVLLVLDAPLGLVALLGLLPLFALTAWFRNASEKAYRATRELIALVIVHFVESLGGIRAVHAFRREPRNQQIFEDLDARYTRANLWSMRLAGIYGPGTRLVGALTTGVVLFYGAQRVIDGETTVGVLAAFLLYLRRFWEPIQELSQFFALFQSAAAGLEKLSGVLEEQPSVPEPAEPAALPRPRGRLDVDGVRFAYRPGVPVLHHLDLTVPAGQTLALVGATGSGKTTIARLLARFYDPTEGEIRLDGVDLRRLATTDLRRAVAMVTQESFVFSGTVADNILFGRPTASRREVEDAARAVGAHEMIEALPEGYDTDVRKRGGRLSAGQRQLVAFARAFLADPRVLILDEATSSLDIPSERLVQRALQTLLADRTAVIIAHRLSTVEIADRVLVIDAGRVIEDGSPAELLRTGGRYQALHQAWLDSLV